MFVVSGNIYKEGENRNIRRRRRPVLSRDFVDSAFPAAPSARLAGPISLPRSVYYVHTSSHMNYTRPAIDYVSSEREAKGSRKKVCVCVCLCGAGVGSKSALAIEIYDMPFFISFIKRI